MAAPRHTRHRESCRSIPALANYWLFRLKAELFCGAARPPNRDPEGLRIRRQRSDEYGNESPPMVLSMLARLLLQVPTLRLAFGIPGAWPDKEQLVLPRIIPVDR